MDVETYRRRRLEIAAATQPRQRIPCLNCFQPEFSCYCARLRPFTPPIEYVILIHPIEASRRVATGRMSHLCMKGSRLIRGHDFTHNAQINELLADPSKDCHLLYPGIRSKNLTPMGLEQRRQVFAPGKTPVLFVIDGTWGTAKRMVNGSENLFRMPRVMFTPVVASRFRVRKQPKPHCVSTIEAIHHSIDLIGPAFGADMVARPHDHLLEMFDSLVEQQIQLSQQRNHRHRKAARA